MAASIRPLLAAALLAANAAALGAFTFEPMSAFLDPSGPGAVRTYRLRNVGADRVAVRVRILTRETGADGEEVNGPVEEGQFVVFPSRFVLEAGAVRALKVQWTGGGVGPRERAFRIVAEQVPVEFEEAPGSGINLLFRYVGALYVKPADAAPAEVRPVSAVGSEVSGKRGVLLRLRNDGGVHAVMLDVSLTLAREGGQPAVLPADALVAVEGENLLAGAERSFFIPWPDAEIGGAYDARIGLTSEY